MTWEASTLDSWAAQYSIDAKSNKFSQVRSAAITQMSALRQALLAQPEKYEKQAREYKSTEEKMRERDEQFSRDVARYYTTAELERTVGPHVLKVPLNYLTPQGLKPDLVLPPGMPIILVLPSLQGMTRENWRPATITGGGPLDRLQVDLMYLRGDASHRRDNDGERVGAMFKNFIASGPRKESDRGHEFYVYDSAKTKMQLPRDGSDYMRVLSDDRPLDSFYLQCDTQGYGATAKTVRCNAYFLDHAHGFYLRTFIPGDYVPMWREIRERFRSLLDDWFVR